MFIYNYDENTNEYLYSETADSDPEESKIQNKFIPLVPKFATLIAPPDVSDNQIPVFNGTEWDIKADYRKNYVKVDDNFQVQEITTIGEQEGFFLVDKTTGEKIKQNPNNFKIQNGKIVQKTEAEIEEEKAQERQKEFEKDFFLTSLGYIRRKVSMATGETKDFLCDLLPAITTGITLGQEIPIITYKEPDFTKEFTLEYLESLQETKIATQQFCTECALQISADFMGKPLTLNE